MRIGLLIAAGLAVMHANVALACEPPPPNPNPPSQEEIDASRRADFGQALDLVDFVVTKRATGGQWGLIRVIRSYKGKVRDGQMLTIGTSDSAACGAGDADLGTRGRMLLSDKEPFRYWPMGEAEFADFVRLGLVSQP
jgi:hypothetical protein